MTGGSASSSSGTPAEPVANPIRITNWFDVQDFSDDEDQAAADSARQFYEAEADRIEEMYGSGHMREQMARFNISRATYAAWFLAGMWASHFHVAEGQPNGEPNFQVAIFGATTAAFGMPWQIFFTVMCIALGFVLFWFACRRELAEPEQELAPSGRPVFLDAGTQTAPVQVQPPPPAAHGDLCFTLHGQCYHTPVCDMVTNPRRHLTEVFRRRACAYCLPQPRTA